MSKNLMDLLYSLKSHPKLRSRHLQKVVLTALTRWFYSPKMCVIIYSFFIFYVLCYFFLFPACYQFPSVFTTCEIVSRLIVLVTIIVVVAVLIRAMSQRVYNINKLNFYCSIIKIKFRLNIESFCIKERLEISHILDAHTYINILVCWLCEKRHD